MLKGITNSKFTSYVTIVMYRKLFFSYKRNSFHLTLSFVKETS